MVLVTSPLQLPTAISPQARAVTPMTSMLDLESVKTGSRREITSCLLLPA